MSSVTMTEKKYASVIDALSANDLGAARDMLSAEIYAKTEGKGSWDCPHYIAERDIQESINLNAVEMAPLSYFGLENMRDRYFIRDAKGEICENPKTFYARVATGMARGDRDLAQRLYNYMARQWIIAASPTMMNIGTKKGLPISCFLNTVPDTLEGIFDAYRENAFMAKYGGGIGTDFSSLRGQNAPLQKSGLRSSGVIPFLKIMDSVTIAVSRNSIRRGAAAAYLRIDHPDIEEFLEIRKASGGDMDRKCLNINNGLVITDAFMEAVENKTPFQLIDPHYKTVVKEVDATDMWRKILKMRAETGEPYMLFIDTVNKAVPEHHREKGLFVRQSNLCTEIVLPTNEERTAVCCLMNLNLERYDEWKHLVARITDDCVTALDNNLETFCDLADPIDFKKAVNSVKHERSIGLGTMGYHGYLMGKGVPFESLQARLINKEIYKGIHEGAVAASTRLGQERGLPLDGGTRRNSYLTSVQPTASTAFLCGEATPAVEPMAGNAYLQKTLSGSFLVKNKYLERLLDEKGMNTQEVWKSVIAAKGSVQHLDILSEEEKKVFRTAYEMNMREIVQQAADRQPFIEQAQSLNLFFQTPVSGKYLDETHRLAWKLGVKSLYYVRSTAPIQAADIDVKVTKRDVATEECAVCQ
jgi:ribonucleoside-diphosphate reductase alpha chain